MSLGIKVGTDAYISDTDALIFKDQEPAPSASAAADIGGWVEISAIPGGDPQPGSVRCLGDIGGS